MELLTPPRPRPRTTRPPSSETEQPIAKKAGAEKDTPLKTCMVPGCGNSVVRIWNHIHQSKKHADLSPEMMAHWVKISNTAASKHPLQQASTSWEAEQKPSLEVKASTLTVKTTGRQVFGDTRAFEAFPADTPILQEFRKFLTGPEGGSKSAQ